MRPIILGSRRWRKEETKVVWGKYGVFGFQGESQKVIFQNLCAESFSNTTDTIFLGEAHYSVGYPTGGMQ